MNIDIKKLVQCEAEQLSNDDILRILNSILDSTDAPVDIPLLDKMLWITKKAFLAGYGAALLYIDRTTL